MRCAATSAKTVAFVSIVIWCPRLSNSLQSATNAFAWIKGSPPVMTTCLHPYCEIAATLSATEMSRIFGVPRCVRCITPNTSQIAIARSEEDRGDTDKLSFSLNCIEEFAEFHVFVLAEHSLPQARHRDLPDTVCRDAVLISANDYASMSSI